MDKPEKAVTNIRVTPELHQRLKRAAIAESSTEGDFISIGETVQRMCDFWEEQKALRKTTE